MGRKKGKKKDAAQSQAPAVKSVAPPDDKTLKEALELQTQELEVLQAIFDRDLEIKSSTPLYTHIFSIHLLCESDSSAAKAEVTLHFDFARGYPLKQPPNITIELKLGLSDAEMKILRAELDALALEKVGDVMVYDLVVHATEFIQKHLKDQSSFFDQMIQRQHDRETEEKRAQDQLLQLAEEQALAKNQEILALIEEQRKKTHEKLKKKRKTNSVRRRRRHKSSMDLPFEEGRGGTDDDDDEEDGESESLASTFYEQAPSNESNDEESSFSDDSLESDSMDVEHPHSRYHGDFRELGLLGRGGGGEVVKVRNRLDRQLYAVKKIKLDPEDPTMKKKILREVKTISRMQHRHIVRYFQAWIENDSGEVSSDDDDDDDLEEALSEEEIEDEVRGSHDTSDSSDMNFGRLTRSSSNDDDDDWLGTMSNSLGGPWSTSKHSTRSRGLNTPFQLQSKSYQDDGFDWEEAPLNEEDDDFSEDENDRFRTRRRQSARLPPRGKRRSERLYIQMEYCEGNGLREVIDKGSLWKEPDKIWTLFRQILEAVVYIHRQGIIHRDIKPPNIFLDAEGTVKLGDFGLAVRPPKTVEDDADDDSEENAKYSEANAAIGEFLSSSTGSSAAELYGKLKLENLESTRVSAPPKPSYHFTSITSMSADLTNASITAGVGTAFYRAPEQEREGQRYNQKADMFSLGIVFFEMWSPPFTTLMERAQALTGLREKHELPSGFNVPENVKEIILWLCNPNPALRPNAAELLTSSLLPAKMEVEGTYLREALQTLANPDGKFFGQLIDALLTQEPVNHVDYTYDHLESVKMRNYMTELRAKTYVKNILQRVFERHGAVEHTTPLLMPRAPEQNYTGITLSTPQNSCSLLDGSGVSVSLPFDLTERLARFVARHNISRLKCYQFDRVYRKNIVGGHPRELMESDFDIVWDDRTSFRLLELEGLEVVSEVIRDLSSSLGSYYLRLNDARMTRGILELSNVPREARREVLKLLSNELSSRVHAGVSSTVVPTFKPGRWKFVAKKMKEHNAPMDSIDALKPFFLLPEDPVVCLDIIEQEVQKLFSKFIAMNKRHDGSVMGDNPSSSVGDKKQWQKRDTYLRRVLKDVHDGISGLRHLLQAMEFLCLSGPICSRIDLGLSPRPERYASGFIFQAVLLVGSNIEPPISSTTTHVIAEGGRYDNLITRFKLPAAYVKATTAAAMGVRFSIDKIVSCVLGAISPSPFLELKPSTTNEIFVGGRNILICSAGKATDTVILRMQIALMLWKHGIGADYLHPEPLHLEDLEDYCAQQRIQWMIIIQKHVIKDKKQVKIRAVKHPSEADTVVNVSSLVEYVMERVAINKTGHHGDSPGGRSPYSYDALNNNIGPSGGMSASAFQPILDVKVLDGKQHTSKENKHKHNPSEAQKIERRVSKWITSSFTSRGEEAMRVLSVDLPFALVREVSSTLMEHGELGVDLVCANNPRYRKQLKYVTDELLALMPTSGRVGRERYVLLHSLVDDRYDLMSLVQSSKSGGRKSNFSSKRSP